MFSHIYHLLSTASEENLLKMGRETKRRLGPCLLMCFTASFFLTTRHKISAQMQNIVLITTETLTISLAEVFLLCEQHKHSRVSEVWTFHKCHLQHACSRKHAWPSCAFTSFCTEQRPATKFCTVWMLEKPLLHYITPSP